MNTKIMMFIVMIAAPCVFAPCEGQGGFPVRELYVTGKDSLLAPVVPKAMPSVGTHPSVITGELVDVWGFTAADRKHAADIAHALKTRKKNSSSRTSSGSSHPSSGSHRSRRSVSGRKRSPTHVAQAPGDAAPVGGAIV